MVWCATPWACGVTAATRSPLHHPIFIVLLRRHVFMGSSFENGDRPIEGHNTRDQLAEILICLLPGALSTSMLMNPYVNKKPGTINYFPIAM
jgi:hypothetical protein